MTAPPDDLRAALGTIRSLARFVDSELAAYQARAVDELPQVDEYGVARTDPYRAGELAGNINALATVRAWLQGAGLADDARTDAPEQER